MKTRGEMGQTGRVMARAAAQILLKINAIRYDVVSDQPFTLDIAALLAHPPEMARLVEMIADVLFVIDPNDVAPVTSDDTPLTTYIATRLHLPKSTADGSRVLPVSWRATNLGPQSGFAVFDDRFHHGPSTTGAEAPDHLCLTTWQDILDVLHMAHDKDYAQLRLALATQMRMSFGY